MSCEAAESVEDAVLRMARVNCNNLCTGSYEGSVNYTRPCERIAAAISCSLGRHASKNIR